MFSICVVPRTYDACVVGIALPSSRRFSILVGLSSSLIFFSAANYLNILVPISVTAERMSHRNRCLLQRVHRTACRATSGGRTNAMKSNARVATCTTLQLEDVTVSPAITLVDFIFQLAYV